MMTWKRDACTAVHKGLFPTSVSVFARRNAHDIGKGFCKFRAVTVAEAPGDIENGGVALAQRQRGSVHFHSSCKRVDRFPVNSAKALFYLCFRGVQRGGKLGYSDMLIHI